MTSSVVVVAAFVSFVIFLPVAVVCNIIVGQSASFSGGALTAGVPYNKGLLAAFHALNESGGINGVNVTLVSMNDQYVPATTVANVNALLHNNPTMAFFIGLVGSGCTAAAQPLYDAARMPSIGAVTGSAVFRTTFDAYSINIRAGYNDEAIAMLRLLIEQHNFKRIAILYQNDPFGIPSKDVIVAALAYMGVTPVFMYTYASSTIGSLNYAGIVANLTAASPQGIIMYAVAGFVSPLVAQFYNTVSASTASSTLFVLSSFASSDIQTYLRTHNIDSTRIYTTMVVPHPKSNASIASQKYREAYDTYAAVAGFAAGTYDHTSFEGYLAGRFAIEAMLRVQQNQPITNTTIMNAIYATRFFQIDDLMMGPFSRGCDFQQSSVGRSSMCNCSQGLRYVATTVFDTAYEYQVVAELSYPMAECWAPISLLNRPTQVGIPIRASASRPHNTNALATGISSSSALAVAGLIDVVDDRVVTTETASVSAANITKVGTDSYLTIALGLEPIEALDDFLILSGMSGGALHSDMSVPLVSGGINGVTGSRRVRREQFFVAPPLEQEIHALCAAASQLGLSTVRLLLSNGVLNDADVVTPLGLSAATYHLGLAVNYFSDAASLASSLTELRSQTELVLVAGISDNATMIAAIDAISSAVTAAASLSFAFLGSETAALWEGIQAAQSAGQSAALGRIIFASSMPRWTDASSSSFSSAYLAAVSGQPLTVRANPNTALGFLTAGVIGFLQARSSTLTPKTLIETLYQFMIVSIEDLSLGPVQDVKTCGSSLNANRNANLSLSSCGCNNGVRQVYFHSPIDVFAGAKVSALSTVIQLDTCYPTYTIVETTSSLNIAPIVGGVVPAVVLVTAFAVGIVKYRAWKRISCAPKSGTQLFAMFIALKKEGSLWERYPDAMPRVLDRFSKMVDASVSRSDCYRVKDVGGACLVVGTTADRVLICAIELSKRLSQIKWNDRYLKTSEAAAAADNDSDIRSASSSYVSEGDIHSAASSKLTSETSVVTDSSSQTPSRSSKASSYRRRKKKAEELKIEFSIAIHCDAARVVHLKERGAYDYSGPAVDGAARLSDTTAGGQILATAPVMTEAVLFGNENCKPFTMLSMGTREVPALQFTPPGTASRDFAAPTDEPNDGLAAALEEQSAGVVNKKVTVATFHVEKIEIIRSSESVAEDYRNFLASLYSAVREAKGYVQSIVGPRIVVSFNAVGPTPQALRRIHQLADDLRQATGFDVYCGISTEPTLVGNFDVPEAQSRGKVIQRRHAALLSHVCDVSLAVLRYGMRHDLPMCALSTSLEELQMFAFASYCDVVRFPGSVKSVGLIAIYDLKSSENDEWMYELQSGERDDPYAAINRMYDRVIKGDAEGLQEASAMLHAWQPSERAPATLVAPLREVIRCNSVEKYLEQQKMRNEF